MIVAPTPKTNATLASLNATWAARAGASGPNNNLRRGKWTLGTRGECRPATPCEARKLNALAGSGYGARVLGSDADWRNSEDITEAK